MLKKNRRYRKKQSSCDANLNLLSCSVNINFCVDNEPVNDVNLTVNNPVNTPLPVNKPRPPVSNPVNINVGYDDSRQQPCTSRTVTA